MKLMKPTFMIAAAAMLGWGLASQTQAAHSDYSCSSCHVPHAASSDSAVPLWNPAHESTTMTGNYSRPSSMDATVGAPDGASKLCLSCHDGSYEHVTDAHAFTSTARPTGELGGLENTHPISFSYIESYNGEQAKGLDELADPTSLADDILDPNGKVQCTSCHDVHATAVADIPTGVADDPATDEDESVVEMPYLRWVYYGGRGVTSAFCRNCHTGK